jgi:biotin synthase
MEGWGYTSVVLQSGEDPFYTAEKLATLIKQIKASTPLAITLSVGERDEATYQLWKDAGMDRYLLRFETSNPTLFDHCHPDDDLPERLHCLHILQQIGIQAGSGFLIGLPGETLEQLANDILFCTKLDLDMIGVGPFIANPNTRFANQPNPFNSDVFYKTIALLRLLNPLAHIPATTAFDAIDLGTGGHPSGRDLVLQRGANVFMPNATPMKYREHYQLYPGKPCINESSDDCAGCVKGRMGRLGRTLGRDAGHSLKNPLR